MASVFSHILLAPATYASGKPHGSPSLLSYNLLFILQVSILSEPNGVFAVAKTFFLILTKNKYDGPPPTPLTSARGHAKNDSRAAVLGGGGVSHPSQLTTGLVIKSVTTSPHLGR